MANPHGEFIWYELLTPDVDAAKDFYGALIGWRFDDVCGSGIPYTTFAKDGPDVGGMEPLTDVMRAQGAEPMWMGYIGVDDVDASAEVIRARGGEIILAPQDIPGVGRFALASDPGGAPFSIMRGASDAESYSFAHDGAREGHCAWNELLTPDPDGTLAFYATCFGWELGERLDMGDHGPYDMLRNPSRPGLFGAMMRAPEGGPRPCWAYYFRVSDIDVAAAHIAGHGGQMTMGPQEIPGGEFVLNATDPQGALFALVGPRAA